MDSSASLQFVPNRLYGASRQNIERVLFLQMPIITKESSYFVALKNKHEEDSEF
jgi:hypothetical protein